MRRLYILSARRSLLAIEHIQTSRHQIRAKDSTRDFGTGPCFDAQLPSRGIRYFADRPRSVGSAATVSTASVESQETPEVFSKTNDETIFYPERNAGSREWQDKSLQFIDQCRAKEVEPGIISQRVEELLIELLAADDVVEGDVPISLKLLQAAMNAFEATCRSTLLPRLHSLTIQIVVRIQHPQNEREAERILWDLIGEPNKTFVPKNVYLNTRFVNSTFSQLIIYYTTRKSQYDFETERRIGQIVKRMKSLWNDPSVPIILNMEAQNAMILALCRQKKVREAYEMLKDMVKELEQHALDKKKKQKEVSAISSLAAFSAVILAFGQIGDPDSASEIIQSMLSQDKGSVIPLPDTRCFNNLLDAWARSRRENAGIKAEQVLSLMKQLYEGKRDLDTKPDGISYAICTNAWACTPGHRSCEKAEAILQEVIKIYEQGGDIEPNLPMFTSAMNAWAKSNRPDALANVKRLFYQFKDLNKATKIFPLTPVPYGVLISAYVQAARDPNCKEKNVYCDEALKVLDIMHEDGVEHNAAVHNAIITLLIQIRPLDALFYFFRLEQRFRNGDTSVDIDYQTFNCCLNTLAALKLPDAADEAFLVLERMFEYSQKHPKIKPNRSSYNLILKILSRSDADGSAEKANNLLLKMYSMPMVKPDFISYLTCIVAWGSSPSEDKFSRVEALLSHYEKTHSKGNQILIPPYNAALSVFAHNVTPKNKALVLKLALSTMDRLRAARVQMNHITYVSFFNIIGNLTDDGSHDNLVRKEYANCINEGLVDHETLAVLRNKFPAIYQDSFGNDGSQQEPVIPKDWSRNVNSRRRQFL